MASLQPRLTDMSATRQKAFEDAKKMQKAVVETCTKSGRDIPRYQLSELIGKGSFGRVYKATSQTTGKLVAVKIIDIEESDTVNPKLADTYSDLLKEINALQLLSESGARNINHVIEALPVGQSMWMITEYCAGGSVATLMRPTAPGGLQEKWIIPILREVAEALRWVHGQGIIHRDIKCANVLITEVGNVQLCDFGVAGVIETKFDKRSTFIGTPHWMAPELFDQSTSYGTEVDIWAFGSLVYEIASGLPPNVTDGIDFSRLGTHLKQHTPRLEGDRYSTGLKDLAAYCMQHEAAKRPTIEQVQHHKYIFKTEDVYPSSSLAHLVRAFKFWEAQGGDRRSLFSLGGAQGFSDLSSTAMDSDEWNFSTTAAFDQQVFDHGDAQDVYDVYGTEVDFSQQAFEETSKPQKGKSRRRPPPHLPSVKAPLEKVFDPNTMSNYEDNSRAYYGRPFPTPAPAPTPASDLPLRDESSAPADVRESLIDLDASLHGGDISQFVDLGTMKAGDSQVSIDYDLGDSPYPRPPLSDPADLSNNRRTQDWKFPTMAPPASANPEMFRFPLTEEGPAPNSVRPTLVHHPTEPYQASTGFCELAPSNAGTVDNRASVGSLIDLDMGLADSTDYARPSTSHSDVASMSGSEIGGANPFELEKHASLYELPTTVREPSIYVSDESEFSNALTDYSDPPSDSEQPHQDDQGPQQSSSSSRPYSLSEFADMDPEDITPQQTVGPGASIFPSTYQAHPPHPEPAPGQPRETDHPDTALPPLPAAPSPYVMQGQASAEIVKNELRRLAMSLGDHLSYANAYLDSLPVGRGGMARMESVSDGS
ncbi:Protein kinase-like domain protein [Metarhizium album ARSEF 1941]|uniref:non-specific serine/threonine protein kinase n=1 Tax=Metarhizium album (strain ARSEF 1941) TaxID=1081103 RepID=A0A0B2WR37_METAS|nr:Protein kinase-like domain protein [Metarhizium album ARSEF 1941]KHN96478.1 Protein kinase-like domain protein [Metarhizium album ARSEF 1941]